MLLRHLLAFEVKSSFCYFGNCGSCRTPWAFSLAPGRTSNQDSPRVPGSPTPGLRCCPSLLRVVCAGACPSLSSIPGTPFTLGMVWEETALGTQRSSPQLLSSRSRAHHGPGAVVSYSRPWSGRDHPALAGAVSVGIRQLVRLSTLRH